MQTKAPGVPFVKGDPRAGRPKGTLNKKTQSEREAAEWARDYAVNSGAFQKSWEKTCQLAERGVQWAVEMVIERVAGKKPFEITTPADSRLVIEVVKTEKAKA